MDEFWKPALQTIVQSKETSAQSKGIALFAFFTLNRDRCETMSMGMGRVTRSGELILAGIRNAHALIGGIVRGRIHPKCASGRDDRRRGMKFRYVQCRTGVAREKGKGEEGKRRNA